MKFEIGKYFTTYSITAGLLASVLGSAFIYLEWFGLSNRLLETVFALLFFWFLLQSDRKVWFWNGFFISLLWFWWILVSFKHYHMMWAIPIGAVVISGIYGGLFWLIARIAFSVQRSAFRYDSGASTKSPQLISLVLKALGLLGLSYIHPLGFDWLKPELLFVHTYLGVNKWQFAIVLLAIVLARYRKNSLFLFLILLAYSPVKTTVSSDAAQNGILLAGTMTSIEEKWDPKLVPSHIKAAFGKIDDAIKNEKKVVILPESVFPFFLNSEPKILGELLKRSEKITIVTGALYLDGKVHRNSTYIIQNGRYTIANKVILVPFGESNPLPQWAGRWVNSIFFDGAADYIASAEPTDFEADGTIYRNAICYEGTSEKLYERVPENMIVISNNGWFIPSVEPTLQKLLLEFYSRKYGTNIYHVANMSPSYTIHRIGI